MSEGIAKVLICDNDHGFGENCFPRIEELALDDFTQRKTLRQLRANARTAGWSYHAGRDWCDACTENEDWK